VTQDVDQVPSVADRVAVLHEGRIALEGGLREVFCGGRDLLQMGLGLPQIAQLAARFNSAWDTNYAWLTLDEAAQDLMEKLRD
jgi:ABC-type methionine transport system ATPase subunit